MNMKKLIAILLSVIILSSCVASSNFYRISQNPKDSVEYIQTVVAKPVGLFNVNDKVDGIQYRVNVTNAALSIIFSGTVVVPAVLCGWFLWHPTCVNDENTAFKNSDMLKNK